MLSTAMLCAAAYIFGVLISPSVDLAQLILYALCMLAAFAAVVAAKKHYNPVIPLIVIFTVLGGIRYAASSHNRLYNTFPDKYVTITGTVYSVPAVTEGSCPYRVTLLADTASYMGKTIPANCKLVVNTKEELAYGDIVTVRGFLKELRGQDNEFQFDYSAYYRSLGITARLTALEVTRSGRSHSLSPAFLSGKIKSVIYSNINTSVQEKDAAYLSAILLGDKSRFSDSEKTLLIKTGAMHTLYSPFVHLCFIMLLAGLLPLKKRKSLDTAVFFMLIAYALFNSSSPIILKGALLAALIIAKKGIFGHSDKIELLSSLVLVMTLIEPYLVFNSGFMMSVISTFLVSVSFTPVYEYLAPSFRKLELGKRPRQIFTIWLIFTFGTLPFSAYYFNGLSPYSILITPLLAPFVYVILILSPALFLLPGAYAVLKPFAIIADICLAVIKAAPHIIRQLPFSYFTLKTPSLCEIAAWCVIWYIPLAYCRGRLRTANTQIASVILAAFICALLPGRSADVLDVYFVNVGQGDGAVLHTGRGETVLIDGGGAAEYQSYNIGENVFLPYLISHGLTHIDTAIVTHYHKDHAEGILAAVENLAVNTLIMPDAMPENPYRRRLEEAAAARSVNVVYLMQSDEIRFKSGLVLKLLAPDYSQLTGTNENDTSFVIEADYGRRTLLFTGDSADEADRSYPKNADILKVAHHGSETASSEAFVDYIRPEYAVISVGRENTYNLPDRSVTDRYEAAGSQILRTDMLGDIHFRIHKTGGMTYSTLKN